MSFLSYKSFLCIKARLCSAMHTQLHPETHLQRRRRAGMRACEAPWDARSRSDPTRSHGAACTPALLGGAAGVPSAAASPSCGIPGTAFL